MTPLTCSGWMWRHSTLGVLVIVSIRERRVSIAATFLFFATLTIFMITCEKWHWFPFWLVPLVEAHWIYLWGLLRARWWRRLPWLLAFLLSLWLLTYWDLYVMRGFKGQNGGLFCLAWWGSLAVWGCTFTNTGTCAGVCPWVEFICIVVGWDGVVNCSIGGFLMNT